MTTSSSAVPPLSASSPPSSRPFASALLALSFATTLAVWATAYLCRMPLIDAPPPLTVALMLACIFVGGLTAGRNAPRPLLTGVCVGLVTGLLNILLIGSIMHDLIKEHGGAFGPHAALWSGASLLLSATLSYTGAVLSRIALGACPHPKDWKAYFAAILPLATLFLIAAGGLVTAFHVGMAVPDWPTSYGYNMFLFPLSQMQSSQGNFYEHAHRLLGSLVGLIALSLAIYLSIADRRPIVKLVAWIIFLGVCTQGLLGGLRVNHNSIPLAIAHGILAQCLLAGMVLLAALSTKRWQFGPTAAPSNAAPGDLLFNGSLVAILCVQLVLGALVRHLNLYPLVHISTAGLVSVLALAAGMRAFALHHEHPLLRRLGLLILTLLSIQILAGIYALMQGGYGADVTASGTQAFSTTLHQVNGALLLSTSVLLLAWSRRLIQAPMAIASTPTPSTIVTA